MSRPGGGNSPIPAQYETRAEKAARASGLPLPVVGWQIQDESGWDPSVTSPTGAEGIAQFEPGTWAQWGHGSAYDPTDALKAYGAYSAYLLGQEGGNLRNELAAYNAGPGNLPAGYGYADKILGESGYLQGGGGNPTQQVPYANPLRDISGLAPERIDMGVDYAGSGPIYAPGEGVITEADYQWAGGVGAVGPGTFITERLSKGPLAGKYVYFAENIDPTVTVGQQVGTSTVIGKMTGQGAGIETGYAAGPTGGVTLAAATGQASTSGDPGANTTAYGRAWSDVLHFLGAPAGVQGGPDVGSLPSGWWNPTGIGPGVGAGFGGGTGGGGTGGGGWGFDLGSLPIIGPILQGGEDTAHALAAIAAVLEKFEHFIEWWSMPSHWVRILSGVAGTGLVIYGVVSLARPRVSLPVLGSTPVVPAGELGPAFGIGAVTAGSVLLFFAFHNTSVNSFSELLGTISSRMHGTPVPVTA